MSSPIGSVQKAKALCLQRINGHLQHLPKPPLITQGNPSAHSAPPRTHAKTTERGSSMQLEIEFEFYEIDRRIWVFYFLYYLPRRYILTGYDTGQIDNLILLLFLV